MFGGCLSYRTVHFRSLGTLVVALILGAFGCGSGYQISAGSGGNQGGGGSNGSASLGATVASQGIFSPGEQGAVYTVVVFNSGTAATVGTVTVVDPPTGFTVTGMSGTNWMCTVATTTCMNNNSVAAGQTFSPITVEGNVTSAAGTPVSIPISLSGGAASAVNVTPTPTITVAAVALTIRKSHGPGNFTQGQQGAVYGVYVSNGTNAGPTYGVVTVTEIPPSGGELAVTDMVGTNWACTVATLTCTRSESLAGGASYDPIYVTVNVSATAASPQINQVMVSGGGSPNATTSDSTSIDPASDVRYTTIQAGTQTRPQEINQSGDIVGWIYDSNGAVHGFVRTSAGILTVFEAPGALETKCCYGTFATSINSFGTVVGYFPDSLGTHGYTRAQDGTFTIFDVKGVPGALTQPSSINDSGVITGTVTDMNQELHGFVRAADGTIATFDAPGVLTTGGGQGTTPEKISAEGIVVGYFRDTNSIVHGFERAVDGTITVLDGPAITPPCNCGTQPMGINASGTIVGITYDAGVVHGFIRGSDGTYTLFDPPDAVISGTGSNAVSAVAINDNNQIVGNYRDSNGVQHGFLRNVDGSFTVLDDPNSKVTNSFGTATTHINKNGAVIGYYGDAFGHTQGYVWQ